MFQLLIASKSNKEINWNKDNIYLHYERASNIIVIEVRRLYADVCEESLQNINHFYNINGVYPKVKRCLDKTKNKKVSLYDREQFI